MAVVGAIANLTTTYNSALTTLHATQARRKSHQAVLPLQPLEASLKRALQDIEREEREGVERFGDEFVQGDGKYTAIAALHDLTQDLKLSLIEPISRIALTDMRTDFRAIINLADLGRKRATRALDDLYERLLQAESDEPLTPVLPLRPALVVDTKNKLYSKESSTLVTPPEIPCKSAARAKQQSFWLNDTPSTHPSIDSPVSSPEYESDATDTDIKQDRHRERTSSLFDLFKNYMDNTSKRPPPLPQASEVDLRRSSLPLPEHRCSVYSFTPPPSPDPRRSSVPANAPLVVALEEPSRLSVTHPMFESRVTSPREQLENPFTPTELTKFPEPPKPSGLSACDADKPLPRSPPRSPVQENPEHFKSKVAHSRPPLKFRRPRFELPKLDVSKGSPLIDEESVSPMTAPLPAPPPTAQTASFFDDDYTDSEIASGASIRSDGSSQDQISPLTKGRFRASKSLPPKPSYCSSTLSASRTLTTKSDDSAVSKGSSRSNLSEIVVRCKYNSALTSTRFSLAPSEPDSVDSDDPSLVENKAQLPRSSPWNHYLGYCVGAYRAQTHHSPDEPLPPAMIPRTRAFPWIKEKGKEGQRERTSKESKDKGKDKEKSSSKDSKDITKEKAGKPKDKNPLLVCSNSKCAFTSPAGCDDEILVSSNSNPDIRANPAFGVRIRRRFLIKSHVQAKRLGPGSHAAAVGKYAAAAAAGAAWAAPSREQPILAYQCLICALQRRKVQLISGSVEKVLQHIGSAHRGQRITKTVRDAAKVVTGRTADDAEGEDGNTGFEWDVNITPVEGEASLEEDDDEVQDWHSPSLELANSFQEFGTATTTTLTRFAGSSTSNSSTRSPVQRSWADLREAEKIRASAVGVALGYPPSLKSGRFLGTGPGPSYASSLRSGRSAPGNPPSLLACAGLAKSPSSAPSIRSGCPPSSSCGTEFVAELEGDSAIPGMHTGLYSGGLRGDQAHSGHTSSRGRESWRITGVPSMTFELEGENVI
ncbi:MAG: hypothetical protein M1831_005138 [Alyxoria varia]|nr:MAG: hypothetical protein M1831_005138 [Alyxoria varia]